MDSSLIFSSLFALLLVFSGSVANVTKIEVNEWNYCSVDCCSNYNYVRRVSVESTNYPGRYWRQCQFLAYIDNNEINPNCNTATFQKDAAFLLLEPGLTGAAGTVSFESIAYPGRFLRHQDFRVKLHTVDGTDLFNNDATFLRISGLHVSPSDTNSSSFESVNYPKHYIRHCSDNLYVDNNALGNADCDATPEVYLKDVTFDVVNVLRTTANL